MGPESCQPLEQQNVSPKEMHLTAIFSIATVALFAITEIKGQGVIVTCSLTVDNRINGVYKRSYIQEVNGPVPSALGWQQLHISGGPLSLDVSGADPADWTKEKTITFKARNDEKAELKIEGEDGNDDNHCTWGGLLMHCTASDVQSPWHNFKSDMGHWRAEDNSKLCSVNNDGMVHDSIVKPFMRRMLELGSMKIWTNKPKVSLIGSPFSGDDETKKCYFFGIICLEVKTPRN